MYATMLSRAVIAMSNFPSESPVIRLEDPIAAIPLDISSRSESVNANRERHRWIRARRPKRCKLANSPRLRQAVTRKLRLNWSPEQIAGWLKRAHPEDEFYCVSHETTIAAYLFKHAACLKERTASPSSIEADDAPI